MQFLVDLKATYIQIYIVYQLPYKSIYYFYMNYAPKHTHSPM